MFRPSHFPPTRAQTASRDRSGRMECRLKFGPIDRSSATTTASVKGGVKLDHRGGEKLDHFPRGVGLCFEGFAGAAGA